MFDVRTAYFNKLLNIFRDLGLTAELTDSSGNSRIYQVDDLMLLGKDMNEKVEILKFVLNSWKLEKALKFTETAPVNVLGMTSISKLNTYFKELETAINALFLDKDMIGSVDVSIEKSMRILDSIKLANESYQKKLAGLK